MVPTYLASRAICISQIGSKAVAKRKPLAGQPCRTPLAKRDCPRSAPANSTNTSQEATEKVGQLNVLKHREDPRVIDTGISSSRVSQKKTRFLRSTRDMGQSGGLNFKDVVCHLPRSDASLRGVNASHSVPMKASNNSRGKEFAITIAQS